MTADSTVGWVCLSIGPSKKSGTYMMCARSLRDKVAETDETDWLRAMLVSIPSWRGLSGGHFRGSAYKSMTIRKRKPTAPR